MDRYYLDERGFHHILLGHRDLRNFSVGIKETVENPTHVYTSSYNYKRYQFVSQNVVSSGGRAMSVIIEHEITTGRVVTASPRATVNGILVWDSNAGLYASYDDRSDVLYFSRGPSRPAYASDDENDDQVWLRFFEEDNTPAGMTIFEASQADLPRRNALTARVAEFLGLESSQVKERWDKLMVRS